VNVFAPNLAAAGIADVITHDTLPFPIDKLSHTGVRVRSIMTLALFGDQLRGARFRDY